MEEDLLMFKAKLQVNAVVRNVAFIRCTPNFGFARHDPHPRVTIFKPDGTTRTFNIDRGSKTGPQLTGFDMNFPLEYH